MITSALKNLYRIINNKAVHGSDKERMPYKDQVEYLKRFPEPKDDFERSYFKYKCFIEYCYYKRKWILVFYNIGAIVLLPTVYSKLKKAEKHMQLEEKFDAVIENVPRLPNVDVIPEELVETYDNIKEVEQIDYTDSCLTDTAIEIYKELKKRYFFHFYFRVIVLQKLGLFSSFIKYYQPNAIVFYSCEREFSGPLQTLLCERSGTQYITFMHGDYLSTLCFAFQRYSMYYVWDEAYQKMFEDLKCECYMPIYKPKKLKGIADAIDENDCKYFTTYYFSDETREEAVRIHEVFSIFENYGLKTKIRPHPRFSDMKMLQDVFHDVEIEDPQKQNLKDSITCSLFIVGLNTTVLSEAFFSGKKIVIDNISNPEKYDQLSKRGYIMINRTHILLSELKNGLYKKYDNEYSFFK